ncbi:VOC family protein [Streptomyces sp. NPDC085946]|uniref:VOC family protein n=1 Tax=Streptomyces sp. NPDC085946 TaxID=3365744 RepID=UPI0037D8E643
MTRSACPSSTPARTSSRSAGRVHPDRASAGWPTTGVRPGRTPPRGKQAHTEPGAEDLDAARARMPAPGAMESPVRAHPGQRRVLPDPAGRPFSIHAGLSTARPADARDRGRGPAGAARCVRSRKTSWAGDAGPFGGVARRGGSGGLLRRVPGGGRSLGLGRRS